MLLTSPAVKKDRYSGGLSTPYLDMRIRMVPLLGLAIALAACQPSAPELPTGSTASPSADTAASKPTASMASEPVTPLTKNSQTQTALLLGTEDWLIVGQQNALGTVVLNGAIAAARKADLRAEVGAVVLQTLRENGDRVRKGELLISLDAQVLRENLASAEESLRNANQSLDSADRQYQRLKALSAQGMVSLQALEESELRRHAAQSESAAARARLSTARQQLERTQIRAPFDGILSGRKVSSGDNVQPGRELVQIIDPASTRFEGWASAEQVTGLRIGQEAELFINGWTQTPLRGRIRQIDATAHPLTRQVGVLVDFESRGVMPMVGLYAEARLQAHPATSTAMTVPDSALVRTGDMTQVWRWLPQGHLQLQTVELGPRNARHGHWPVLRGLSPGDRILRHPGSPLKNGMLARERNDSTER